MCGTRNATGDWDASVSHELVFSGWAEEVEAVSGTSCALPPCACYLLATRASVEMGTREGKNSSAAACTSPTQEQTERDGPAPAWWQSSGPFQGQRKRCVRTAVDVRSRAGKVPPQANQFSMELCHGTCPKTLQYSQLCQSKRG